MEAAIQSLEAYKVACDDLLNVKYESDDYYRNLNARIIAAKEILEFLRAGGGDKEVADKYIFPFFE